MVKTGKHLDGWDTYRELEKEEFEKVQMKLESRQKWNKPSLTKKNNKWTL